MQSQMAVAVFLLHQTPNQQTLQSAGKIVLFIKVPLVESYFDKNFKLFCKAFGLFKSFTYITPGDLPLLHKANAKGHAHVP